MKKHKVDWGPGYRFFRCECGSNYKRETRDCTSSSGEICILCGEFTYPVEFEKHYYWPTDRSGNLLNDYDYENNKRVE